MSVYGWESGDSDVEDKVKILVETYDNALSQLEDPIKEQKKECVFLGESSKWSDAFKQFEEKMAGDFTVSEMEQDAALTAMMSFAKNSTGRLLRLLKDHLFPITE